MLRHTRGGFELRNVRKLAYILEGHLPVFLTKHLSLNRLEMLFLEEGNHGDGAATPRFLNALGGQGILLW